MPCLTQLFVVRGEVAMVTGQVWRAQTAAVLMEIKKH